jgi:hypothetical protein
MACQHCASCKGSMCRHSIPSRAPVAFFGVLGLVGLLRVEVTLSCVPLLTCSWRSLACFLTGRRRFSMVS